MIVILETRRKRGHQLYQVAGWLTRLMGRVDVVGCLQFRYDMTMTLHDRDKTFEEQHRRSAYTQ